MYYLPDKGAQRRLQELSGANNITT